MSVPLSPTPEPPDCPDHKPVQHRDGKPPWCKRCGWTSAKAAVPARPIAPGKWCVGCGSPIGPDDEEGPGVEFPQGMHHFQCWENRHYVDPDAPVSSPTPDAEGEAAAALRIGREVAARVEPLIDAAALSPTPDEQAAEEALLWVDAFLYDWAETEAENADCARRLAALRAAVEDSRALVVVREQLTQAQTQLNAIREMHKPCPPRTEQQVRRLKRQGLWAGWQPWCMECSDDSPVAWPCATFQAILSAPPSPPTYTTEEPS